MEPEQVIRRMAAILAADVAGYSRLMGADEEGTLAQLKAHRRELVDPKIAEHHGRLVKTTGDGMLIEFASIVDALRCAVNVQRGMMERNAKVREDRRIEFRVGINLGDVIIEGDDIYGDRVNIAARLEGLADPSGICVSRVVRDQVRDKLEMTFDDMGEQRFKNIARPVRVFRIASPHIGQATASAKPALALPDKPSIAVLPFQNMSGDPEQEYFADGMVDDIVTALSHFPWLFVIARNSSFTYKGRAVDVKQVGSELGVRYVLEGSVRKAGDRVRISGQLIDASNGAHLWADRFEGALGDIFDLQDQVTARVVGSIMPKVERAEIERTKRKPTANLDAYDCFLRGTANVYQQTREANSEALQMFYRAIDLDPSFASAYAFAAGCYQLRKANGWVTNRDHETAETKRLAWEAVRLGKNDAFALSWAGDALAYVLGDLDDGIAFIDQALQLNPNLAAAWNHSGWVRMWLGQPEIAIEHFARAMRLSPLDASFYGMLQRGTAYAHFDAGNYDEASSWAEMAFRHQPTKTNSLHVIAASNAFVGRLEQAQKTVARLRQLNPSARVSTIIAGLGPYRKPEHLAKYAEGLRKAGLPE